MKSCASFGGGGNLEAEEDGDERLVLVDRPEERLVRLELHRVDAHDELRQQLVLEEVDRLVRLERLVAVDDEEEVLEEDAEVWDDAFSPRRDDGTQRRPVFVDEAELPDAVEARREVHRDEAECPAP